ncbi:hypothetical protein BKP37_02215 [Anaerobacillus alkalilacustris]|uniref:Bacteriophage abortive infection AbiH n=1 Tax=Anaerobacillus alkalilacustris TaxID=393763 RepID=A0A1S2LXX8_9BACI|nr:bacteriophage abortive infection AbiH family protein [Anaerobacillus alkalilacustris]OIJ17341.1 hypothetical protein BKP37_02215 [Anaerobacillus alkalilacustris]
MNLFIIGNGFDRAHDLPTNYIDFRKYLERVDWHYLTNLEAPYNCVPESTQDYVEKYLWREFENNLSEINDTEIIDGALSIDMGLESGDVGIEDTLNAYWEERYGYIQQLNDFIKSWIEEINVHVKKKTSKIKRNNDLYISFNYTLLLEEVYKIDKSQILHIHGSVDEDDMTPIIGHGNLRRIEEAKALAVEAENNFLEKETSIFKALVNYYESTLKDVTSYLFIHSNFFEKLKSVDSVNIVGHSFGDVDLPYFKRVMDSIPKNAIWNIYFYDDNDASVFKDKILSIGVRSEQVKMLQSKEFFDKD